MTDSSVVREIRGAVYIPAKSYNAYQMWRDYEPDVIERDFEYAAKLNLNALRIWLSYEYWLENRDALSEKYKHFLSAANERGLKVMPSLFEKCGVAPTREALDNTDPLTAVCVHSPAKDIYENPQRYVETAEYISWFMERFGGDQRQLAIEVINEPIGFELFNFAREMFKAAAVLRKNVPLTIGCINLEHNMYFLDLGIDILQHHDNFPRSEQELEVQLRKLKEASQLLGKPVWLTEWQRIRSTASGFGDQPIGPGEWQPGYKSYANVLEKVPEIGTFLWSLMIKAAYLPSQRKKGTLNGVFHEDGAVWDLEDARAISGDAHFQAAERREWPEWLKAIPEAYLAGELKSNNL
ncbi:MAG: glycoside hydrolase [Paenibacillus sp.]|jgi:hypothetical protein|nr:glycoside hydrolase [Paenibacillus sp.]